MYNNIFDKELIDYVLNYFELQKVGQINVISSIVGVNIYQIRFENEYMVLQLFYEQESEDCEAQIRITNILLKGELRNKGISKHLINSLFDYCHNHGDMSLWIYELINRSWKEYLTQNGAKVFQEESMYEGAIVLICNKID